MGIIRVDGIRVRAHHGCLPEEGVIGGDYVVNVRIDADFTPSVKSDELDDTVDYCVVFELVKQEMAIRSKLIEHVAHRIVTQLRNRYPAVNSFEVEVIKIVPPMNGPVDQVSVLVQG
jgi:dihydroneopterin aldolase